MIAVALAAVVVAAAQLEPSKENAAKTKKSAPAKKKSSKKSSAKSSAAKKAPSKSSSTTTRRASAKKKASGPRGQQRPTTERYKEIEEALAARGYLLEEPTGKWGTSSVEALRSFQADHDLPSTGRIDALSLTQLGLGPQPQE